MLYDFMTEVLVAFQTEFVIFCEIKITEFDEKKNSLTFTAYALTEALADGSLGEASDGMTKSTRKAPKSKLSPTRP